MRILSVTNSLMTGGAEKVFMLEARELERLGHEVHMLLLFKRGELADSLELSPERLHVVGMSSVFDIVGFIRALRIARKVRPEVVYATLNEGNFVARNLAFFFPHTRLVMREANMADVKSRLYRWGDELLGWRAQRIVCVSRAVGDSVLSYAPHLKKRIRVLYNAVSVPEHVVSEVHGGVRLLNVGSLTPKKDQRLLVRALPLLPPHVSVTLVGDGRERAALEALADTLGVADRITFAGTVPPERVGAYYRNHDVFVLTSSREGCPNVVLEALSHRLPVVAFDIPGMSEFVSSEWGALVKDRTPEALATAVQEFVASVDVRTAKGAGGFAHVSKAHSIEQHISALSDMLSLSHT